jgi:hypothetical protein
MAYSRRLIFGLYWAQFSLFGMSKTGWYICRHFSVLLCSRHSENNWVCFPVYTIYFRYLSRNFSFSFRLYIYISRRFGGIISPSSPVWRHFCSVSYRHFTGDKEISFLMTFGLLPCHFRSPFSSKCEKQFILVRFSVDNFGSLCSTAKYVHFVLDNFSVTIEIYVSSKLS